MARLAVCVMAYARWIIIALALSGCAGVGYTPGSGVDVTRLENAILTDDVHYVRGAIQSGDISLNQLVPAAAWPDGAPLIVIAARAGALDILRYLISAGAELNARSPVGETALMLAAFFTDDTQPNAARASERHEQAARLLVAAGCSLENLPYHYTPLAYAAYQGNERLVRFLLERGARVDADAANGGTYINTPLMMAAIQGHESIARSLLRAGADADVRVYGGHTAAEFAAKYNHRALSQLLLCAQRQYGVGGFGPQCRALLGYDPREERQTAR